MKKHQRFLLNGFVILVGLLFIAYFTLIAYVTANKKSLIKQVTQEVSEKINGNVSIEDIELSFVSTFPRVSVLLNKVVITDSMYALHHHTFFRGDKVYAQVSIPQLIRKNLQINGLKVINAEIDLFTDTSGYTNEYLMKPQKAPTVKKEEGNENSFKSVNLKNVSIKMDNKKQQHLYNVLVNKLNVNFENSVNGLLLSSKTDLLIHDLAFNVAKGSYLKEKTFKGNFDLRFDKKLEQLQADSINVRIDGNHFNISARFDLKGPDPHFDLKIYVKDILYPSLKSLLTPKISQALSIINLDNRIDAEAFIHGPLKCGHPLINAKWKVKDARLTTPFFDFGNASFSGSYTNEADKALPRKDSNSRIEVRNFSGDWYGLPVVSQNIIIQNLTYPLLMADLQSGFSLTELNNLFGSSAIQLKEGKGKANLTYEGPIVRNKNTNSFVNGNITFSDGTLFYQQRDVEMKNVNGKLIFKNSDVIVENLKCVVLNNSISLNGHANNLLTLMNSEANKVFIDWNVYSPSLNLQSFIYLLKPENKSKKRNKAKFNAIADKIDEVLAQGKLRVNLKADEFKYKKFIAKHLIAEVSLLPEKYEIHRVSMRHGGGSLHLSGSLKNRNSNYHEVIFASELKNADVNKIFKAFNNFGQNGIEAKNLEGKLTARATGTFGLNNEGEAYRGSVVGDINFSLKDGALNNYEPIQKIQKYIFKKRDFKNIRFAELKDHLEIAHEEITINRMEIASSVFTIFVEGVYSMRGNTDLSIQIPLSNLKKRKAGHDPENTGSNKKKGTSLYLRGRPGADGSIQFKVDLFNRFKKSNEKDESKEKS